jgi:hypothetical protein
MENEIGEVQVDRSLSSQLPADSAAAATTSDGDHRKSQRVWFHLSMDK